MRVKKNVTLQQVLTLMTGTAVSQGLFFILMVPLARLYTSDDFGNYAIYQSIAAIIVTIAALKYDMSVMLPKIESEAVVVQKLARACILLTSIAVTVIGALFGILAQGRTGNWPIKYWLPALGITVFLTADTLNLQFWLNRNSKYKAISANRIVQTVAISLFQLGLVLVGGGTNGLILGSILGLLTGYIYAFHQVHSLPRVQAESYPTLVEMAKKYRKMPLLNGPTSIIDSIRLNGINILIATISISSLGQFNMAWKTVQATSALIQSAISQVLLRRLATVERGKMRDLLSRTLRAIALADVPLITILAIVIPWAIPFVFGAEWVEAGHVAQALCPWIAVNILSSPTANVFVVTNKQGWLLLFSVVYCATPLLLLLLSPWALIPTIWILSISMGSLLIALIAIAFWVAQQYDQNKQLD